MQSAQFLPKGTNFVRYALALCAAKGNAMQADEIASYRWGTASIPARFCKAAIEAGSTTPGSWGAELADWRNATAEFFELVAQGTIIGQLAGIRRMPLKVRTISATSGATASWTGPGKMKPIRKLAFASGSLEPLKLQAMTVVTEELLRSADPASEAFIRADLLRAVREEIDASFVDPANTGIANEKPASVTSDANVVLSVGDDPDALEIDLKRLVSSHQGNLETSVLVMRPYAGFVLNSDKRPNVGARGGEIAGIPVITSKGVPSEQISLIDAAGIAYGEGEAEIRVGTQGAIAMVDEADSPPVTAQVSLFQTNSAALLCERFTNFRVARPGAVTLLKDAGWSEPVFES